MPRRFFLEIIFCVVVFLAFLDLPAVAEQDTIWVQRYDGTNNSDDKARAIAIDDSGNIFVTGASGNSFVIIKYRSNGDTLWTRTYSGGGACDIALDDSGNAYVTGTINNNYTTVKYLFWGYEVWAGIYSNGEARAIAVDSSGNAYVTGTNGTIKYDTNGNQLWVKPWGGVDIVLDNSGNACVTDTNITIKYDTNGNPLWGEPWGGVAIAVDNSGNIYVTGRWWNGSNYDYTTIKYTPSGYVLWQRFYDGSGYNDEACAIGVDNYGNAYVTGSSNNGTNSDYTTIKYKSNGDTAWVRRYDGPGDTEDSSCALVVSNCGNAYVTGTSLKYEGTDYATIAYDSSGNQLWLEEYNGPGNSNDHPYAIAVDDSENVTVTGSSQGSGTGSDCATAKYPPSRLAGYWKFDEGGGSSTSDYSGYENDGYLQGNPTWVEGIFGNALCFNRPGDFVRVEDNPHLGISGPFTIMAWVWPETLVAGIEMEIIAKADNYFLETDDQGRLRISFWDVSSGEYKFLESPGNILSLKIWQHIAGVWDGEKLKLYKNGQEVASASVGRASPERSTTPLRIGGSESSFFPGGIDEAKVYSKALSKKEIREEIAGTRLVSGFWTADHKIMWDDEYFCLLDEKLWRNYKDLQLVHASCFSGRFASVAPRFLEGEWSIVASTGATITEHRYRTKTEKIEISPEQPFWPFEGLHVGDWYYHGFYAQYIKCITEVVGPGGPSAKDAWTYANKRNFFRFLLKEEARYASSGGAADSSYLNTGDSYAIMFCGLVDSTRDDALSYSKLYDELRRAGYADETIDFCWDNGPLGVPVDRKATKQDLENALGDLATHLGPDKKALIIVSGHGCEERRAIRFVPIKWLWNHVDLNLSLDSSFIHYLLEEIKYNDTLIYRTFPPQFFLTTKKEWCNGEVLVMLNDHIIGSLNMSHSDTGGDYQLEIPDDALSYIASAITDGDSTLDIRFELSASDSFLVATDDDFYADPSYPYGHYGIGVGVSVSAVPRSIYLAGDANGDGIINVTDVVYLINYLFVSGPAPNPLEVGDVNCDGVVDVSDVVYLINYLFIGGPPPSC